MRALACHLVVLTALLAAGCGGDDSTGHDDAQPPDDAADSETPLDVEDAPEDEFLETPDDTDDTETSDVGDAPDAADAPDEGDAPADVGCSDDTDCDDDDPCTEDHCDLVERTCSNDPLDADDDGYTAATCGGDDCDDERDDVNPGASESCTGGVDEDCDLLVDCNDPQCFDTADCPCAVFEAYCRNALDDDCDTLLDCLDTDCTDPCACAAEGTDPCAGLGTCCDVGCCDESADPRCCGGCGIACPVGELCCTGTCAGCCADSDCDDTNECTADACSAGTCLNTPLADASTCTGGICCTGTCITGAECCAGRFNCYGNEVQQCASTAAWETIAVCDAYAGFRCDPTLGSCVHLPAIGSAVQTGTIYRYAVFSSSVFPFLGGYDVASYGDLLYVNRGNWLDVYQVTLGDSDGDTLLEPDQHPDNPSHRGPIEYRGLTRIATYDKVTDSVPLGSLGEAGMYAENDRIFMLGPLPYGDISAWDFATHASSVAVDSLVNFPLNPMTSGVSLAMLGYGSRDGLWYAGASCSLPIGGSGCPRHLYSFHTPTQAWMLEFAWASLGGSHADGLEVVEDPSSGEQYVYLTDMDSEFLGQYRRNATGGWVQVNAFYKMGGSWPYVEGMGFGALNHFWATSGTMLYEFGGGDVTQYLE